MYEENKQTNNEMIEASLKEHYDNLSEAQKAPLVFAAKKILNNGTTMLLIKKGRNINRLKLPSEYRDHVPEDVFARVVQAMSIVFAEGNPYLFALTTPDNKNVEVQGFCVNEEGSFAFMSAEETEEAFNIPYKNVAVKFSQLLA